MAEHFTWNFPAACGSFGFLSGWTCLACNTSTGRNQIYTTTKNSSEASNREVVKRNRRSTLT